MWQQLQEFKIHLTTPTATHTFIYITHTEVARDDDDLFLSFLFFIFHRNIKIIQIVEFPLFANVTHILAGKRSSVCLLNFSTFFFCAASSVLGL